MDGNPHVLSALADLLDEEPGADLVAAALRVDDALALAMVQLPDVVLVDAQSPGGGAERVLSEIRAFLPSVRIAILAASPDATQADRAVAAGADLYVAKDTDIGRLVRQLAIDMSRLT